MEGEVKFRLVRCTGRALLSMLLVGMATGLALAQDKAPATAGEGSAITLRKSIKTRPYQGREIEGEDHQIRRGDSLWRILVEEKGVSGRQFVSYLVIVRGLNPQIKNLDRLRVGDTIFIPLRPSQGLADEPLGTAPGEATYRRRAGTTEYRVKAGEHLYQILREQLSLTDERKVAQYFALVQDLNPERKNWDTLIQGEIIRLPVMGLDVESRSTLAAGSPPSIRSEATSGHKVEAPPQTVPMPTTEKQPQPMGEAISAATAQVPTIIDRRAVLRAPANEHLGLFTKVAESMGGQMQRSGEEVIELTNGVVRFDKTNYPVVFNPSLKQRVVLDPENKIPASLRAKLADASIGAPIVPMASGVTLQEAVSQLFAGLGYQALPANRPVIIQEEGVAYEARGDWMALAPQESNKPQEIYIVNLTESGAEIPEYLRRQLATKGLLLREVGLAPAAASRPIEAKEAGTNNVSPAKVWPREKRDIVDNLLFAFGIPFGVAETVSAELEHGIRVEARTDRVFELSGKRVALFFKKLDVNIRQAFLGIDGVRAVELDLSSISSRELISRLLSLLGDRLNYREHRFPAAGGPAQDRLTITAWGFHVPERSLFITDRRIPAPLNRFFSEQGLEIVYFQ